MGLSSILSNLSLSCFALAAVCYLLAVPQKGRRPLLDIASLLIFAAATILASIAASVSTSHLSNISEAAGLMLTAALGWLGIAAHIGLKAKRMGALLAPLATLILLVQAFVIPSAHEAKSQELVLSSNAQSLLSAHIGFAIVGQACAIAACGIALLYLWQQNLLKRKMLEQLQDSPAIDRLAQALMAGIWSGFGFITLGLISGAVLVQIVPSPELRLSAKVAWAGAVWIWYLAILLAKNLLGMPSKRIAQMSLAGFCLLALTYFGIGAFRPWGAG